jgi:hypothetical protein
MRMLRVIPSAPCLATTMLNSYHAAVPHLIKEGFPRGIASSPWQKGTKPGNAQLKSFGFGFGFQL